MTEFRRVPFTSYLIREAAAAADLPLSLVQAVVAIESSGRPYAYKPEPPYRWLWDVRKGEPFRAITPAERASEYPPEDFRGPAGVTADAEWWGQQASWGLMQVMGATARWLGYTEPDLPALCDPAIGLKYGCLYLARQTKRHGLAAGVAAYNAGSVVRVTADGPYINQGYVDKVMARMAAFEDPKKGG